MTKTPRIKLETLLKNYCDGGFSAKLIRFRGIYQGVEVKNPTGTLYHRKEDGIRYPVIDNTEYQKICPYFRLKEGMFIKIFMEWTFPTRFVGRSRAYRIIK
jgi:hypothetical protein